LDRLIGARIVIVCLAVYFWQFICGSLFAVYFQIHLTPHEPQDSPWLPDLLAHGRVDGGKLAAVFDSIID
jgi:hypothetical protein